MNEELTNEDKVFQAWLNDAATSEKCVWTVLKPEFITRLARMYFEERAKPKVWEFAPITADRAVVHYYVGDTFFGEKTYTREIQKTRARIMAEEIASAHISNKSDLVDIIEQTINAHMEELKEASHDK